MITSRTRCFKLVHLFVVVLLSVCMEVEQSLGLGVAKIMCIERERQALLNFKQGLIDDYERLSSWGSEKEDCCEWEGVQCNNRTGHVIMLDLHTNGFDLHTYEFDLGQPLRGKISPSLLELQHLNYLDLSNNDFEGSVIPKFIGSLRRLRYLNLTWAHFSGPIPHNQLGNLTSLRSLDLSYNYGLNMKNLDWLSHLSLLGHLDLSYVNLSKAIDWVEAITNLPLLTELKLFYCQLPSVVIPSSHLLINSSKSLSILDLAHNSLDFASIHHWLFNFSSSLLYIDLFGNNIQGLIPHAFGNIISLENLDLSDNQLEGGIPKIFGNLSALRVLDLSYNILNQPLYQIFHNLSGRVEKSLEIVRLSNNRLTGSLLDITVFSSLRELYLYQNQLNGAFPESFRHVSSLEILWMFSNQIEGSLPDLSLLSSLKELNVGNNRLNGTLTKSIGSLSKLENLDVSSNYLEGVISEAHFSNVSSLKYLDLSHNSLVLEFRSDWVPPFQLDIIRLSHCKLGPHFPKWLPTQNDFFDIDISDNGILDVPDWFWEQSPKLQFLNLSNNQIYGMLPDLSSKFFDFSNIDLSSNDFNGPIPFLPPNITLLSLSNNSFFGSISCLCNITSPFLSYLDLSYNLLSGDLPNCWMHMELLEILNLGNNNFSGKIPSSMGFLLQIKTLFLNNNNFSGELPSSLKNCKVLQVIDLRENSLSGTIPLWIGDNLLELIVLTVRSNRFYGRIPFNLCHLANLQLLDLSLNNISGTIPKCLNNFTAIAKENSSNPTVTSRYGQTISSNAIEGSNYDATTFLIWKGKDYGYKNTLGLVKAIHLSSNKLTGKIPDEIADLVGMVSLNLSRNNLTGQIPQKIGQLRSLDSLDLSENQLSGLIPASLSQLSRLGVLDLSNNNLSGKIPTSTQLQSYNASSYMGNPGLCGAPLEECLEDRIPQDPPNNGRHADIEEDEDSFITTGFYISIGIGFIVGFWGVCGTLIFNSSWRYAFFKLVKNIEDWLFVVSAVYTSKLKRQLQI